MITYQKFSKRGEGMSEELDEGDVAISKLNEELKGMKTISIWHPINGVWFNLAQTRNGDTITYYTNGVKEEKV
jgi:hypothetical protein